MSPSGHAANADRSCRTAARATIQSAVDVAPSGATVVVCEGTYTEDVIVSKPLSLRGRDAVIQGTATANG
ncbi:MAG TPA: hypothetical protein VLL25_09815, partial [Acidimicrobiales bacterium]|nr:hypothetical protein [Acidimicrobiales bacterium]